MLSADIRTSCPNEFKAFGLTLARLGHSWEMGGKYRRKMLGPSPIACRKCISSYRSFAVRSLGTPTKLGFGLIFTTTAGEKEKCLMQRVENWSSTDPVTVVPIPGVLYIDCAHCTTSLASTS